MHRFPLSLVALLAGCDGAPVACTEIGCTSHLTLSFTGGTWEDGTSYTLTVTGENDGIPCSFTLPDASCNGEPVTVDGDTLTVGVGLTMGTPSQLHVLLESDAGVVHDGDQVVSWGERSYPNGRECDGEDGGCAEGQATIAL